MQVVFCFTGMSPDTGTVENQPVYGSSWKSRCGPKPYPFGDLRNRDFGAERPGVRLLFDFFPDFYCFPLTAVRLCGNIGWNAGVVEQADTRDLKSLGVKSVPVLSRSPAPRKARSLTGPRFSYTAGGNGIEPI